MGLFPNNPLLVYDLTPREIVIISKAKAKEELEKLKHDLSIAYYGEIFARSKKLPKLEKILSALDKPQKKTLSKGDIFTLQKRVVNLFPNEDGALKKFLVKKLFFDYGKKQNFCERG